FEVPQMTLTLLIVAAVAVLLPRLLRLGLMALGLGVLAMAALQPDADRPQAQATRSAPPATPSWEVPLTAAELAQIERSRSPMRVTNFVPPVRLAPRPEAQPAYASEPVNAVPSYDVDRACRAYAHRAEAGR